MNTTRWDAQEGDGAGRSPQSLLALQHEELPGLRNHPESGTTIYTLWPAGNVKTKTDAGGRLFSYFYDGNNRLRQIDAPGTVYDVNITYVGENRTGRGERSRADGVHLRLHQPADRTERHDWRPHLLPSGSTTTASTTSSS
jgi:hypothetical protein